MYENLLEKLINQTADQWNNEMSVIYGQPVNKLLSMFKTRDSSFLIEYTIPVNISKPEISRLAQFQLEIDETYEPNKSIDNKSVAISSIVEKYQIKFNKDDVIFDAMTVVGKIIIGIDFSESNLEECFFSDCVFYACKFNSSIMHKSKFSNCVFNTCEIISTDLTNSIFSRCRIYDSIVTSSSFSYSTFNESIILGSDFSGSDMKSINIINTSITESLFKSIDFSYSELFTVSISICDLSDSEFTHTSIVDSILMSVNILNSNLKYISLNSNTMVDINYDKIYDEVFNMNDYLYSPGMHDWQPFNDTSYDSDTLERPRNSEIDDLFGEDDSDKPWLN
jgi:uncharacterized protein YjbI with pentapeptide repeats